MKMGSTLGFNTNNSKKVWLSIKKLADYQLKKILRFATLLDCSNYFILWCSHTRGPLYTPTPWCSQLHSALRCLHQPTPPTPILSPHEPLEEATVCLLAGVLQDGTEQQHIAVREGLQSTEPWGNASCRVPHFHSFTMYHCSDLFVLQCCPMVRALQSSSGYFIFFLWTAQCFFTDFIVRYI